MSDEPLDPDLIPAAPEESPPLSDDASTDAGEHGGGDGTLLARRYRIGERIGGSPLTDVYRGSDTVLGGTVAIKILSKAYAGDEAFTQRFKDEAKAAEKLNDPNIASVYASGSQKGTTFVVMEYVDGSTLAETLAEIGALDPERAIRIAEEVCRALAAAHSAGIIHRDIRPGNIMLTRAGQVKVMDFGIARRPASGDDAGSAVYLSPEQARGAQPDQRSDVYSLGVVLYEMITGGPPFSGDSAVALAYQHAEKAPTPAAQLVEGLPDGLEAAIHRALEKDPGQRFVSAERFRSALEICRGAQPSPAAPSAIAELAGEEGGQLVTSPHGASTIVMQSHGSERRSDPRIRYAAIGVMVAAAVGLLMLFLVRPSDTVSVPDVRGVPAATGASELADLGLRSRQITMTSLEVASGGVLRTDPQIGSTVKKGTVVTMYIAEAPATVSVPNIVGWTTAVASTQLKPVGVTIGTVSTQSSTSVPKGIIISQNPQAGTPLAPGSSVDVTISAGSSPVIVPNLICANEPSATEQLVEVGLQLQVVGYEASDLCPGYNQVTAQIPAAGSTVDAGTLVSVWTNAPGTGQPSPSPSPTPSP